MILYGITIVTSAFLLFLVQPIVAKQILPWFGGTAAVWTVCVVFFQAVLLAGYAYAHALTRARPRVQAQVHVALLVISLAALPIIAPSAWKPVGDADPTWRIVGLLATTIGLPYFLLSSTGPLIQRWFADGLGGGNSAFAAKARVYRLFAWSNSGSLVGLLIYPFVIEPYAGLSMQSWGWSAGYAGFAMACGACAWRARGHAVDHAAAAIAPDNDGAWRVRGRAVDVAAATAPDGAGTAPTMRRCAFWLACAALGSALLLALTNHITQNIASIPFLWVLPLGLYLLSFVVVFEGRDGRGWYVRRWWLAPVMASIVAMAWALTTQRGVLSIWISLPIFCTGLFLACVFCHGELARTRPAPRWLTQFYLCLSGGGTVGGLFVALVAPRVFDNYWETPIALVALCVLGWLPMGERRASRGPRAWLIGIVLASIASAAVLLAGGGATFQTARTLLPGSQATTPVLVAIASIVFVVATWRRWPVALLAAALTCTSIYAVRYYRFLSQDTLETSRNFYGALRVKESGTGTERRRDLLHGLILHGDQYVDANRRRTPTTYYGPGSGIAIALNRLRLPEEPIDVAMIGLGAGTLTAWGRTGDRYRIYEINRAVVDIAHRDFTYLADSRATIGIVMGDARLSMERELADISARPSDLLAFDVIAVDAFSSDSIPVHLITREALAVFMRRLKPDGIVAFHVSNRFLLLAPVVQQLATDAGLHAIDIVDDPDSDDFASSEWVLVTRNATFANDDVVRQRSVPIKAIAGLPIWTDQFNNLFKILK